MPIENDLSSDAASEYEASDTGAGTTQALLDNHSVVDDPGVLEHEHCRLMEMQGDQSNQERLIDDLRQFVSRARELGRRIEDPRVRQRWQGILTYWSVYAYRTAHLDLDTQLQPFDPSLATSFTDDQYPYEFTAESGKERQETLAWRRLLDECERDLANDHLLTIVGEVGSGRKFLLFDLLLPMLRSGRTRRPELADSENWRYIRVHFDKAPVRDLVRGIAEAEGRDEQWVVEQAHALCTDPTRLLGILESNADTPTLIAFEHFGSLLKASADERAVVTKALACLLMDTAGRYYLAVTLRPRQTCMLSMFGELEHLLQDGRVLLGLTTAELRHLIEEPAQRIGLVYDNGLIDQIMIDIQGETTSLPLLQFTLSRLWAHRERNRITWNAYHKVGAGNNALRIALDEIYKPLSSERKTAFRAILLAMITAEADSGFVSCEVPLTDLHRICGDRPRADELVDLLRRQKLLHERVVDGVPMVTLNNNAILNAWPPLVTWLDEQQVLYRFRTRLKEAAQEWQGTSSESVLWRGSALIGAESEFAADTTLTTCEREFLQASRRRENRERRKRTLTFGAILAGILLALAAFPLAILQHERQQGRSQNAFACLLGGDLPGVILWLNERKAHFDLPFLGRQSQDANLRKFAQVQLPRVQTVPQDNSFLSMAVSGDGTYLATLTLPKPSEASSKVTTDDARYAVTAIPVEGGENIGFVAEAQSSAPAGGLAFYKHSSDAPLCLISGYDRELKCLILDGTKSQPSRLALVAGHKNSQIVDLDVGADVLAVTWLSNDGKHSLSLFQVALKQESGDRTLELKELDNPEGIDGLDIRLATLSKFGDLVVVAGPEADQTKVLKAWRKTPEHNTWTLVPPPAWAISLDTKDRQRLYDYGWTLTNGKAEEKSWQREGSYVRSIAFSRSGLSFATASDDGQVVLWSFSEANATNVWQVAPKIETKMQLGSSIFDVAFRSDDVIATAGRDRTARIWNVHSGTEILPRLHHEGTVEHVSFGADGDTLITKTKTMYRIWQRSEYSECHNLQYSVVDDSDRITIAEIKASQASDGEPTRITQSNVVATVFSRNSKWVGAVYKPENRATFSLVVCKRDAMNQPSPVGQLIALHDLESIPVICFSADEKTLSVAGKRVGSGERHRIYLWNLMSPSATASVAEVPLPPLTGAKSDFSDITFNELAVGYHKTKGVLALVGAQKAVGDKKEGVLCVGTFSLNREDAELKLHLLSPVGKEAGEDKSLLCVGLSPTGDLLAVGSADNTVKLWDVDKLIGAVGQRPAGDSLAVDPIDRLQHSSDVKSLAFSPVGTDLLATVSSDGDASLWSVATTRATKSKPSDGQPRTPDFKVHHDANILCIAFSPKGDLAITGGLDRTARVWDIADAANGTGARSGPKLVGIFRHQNPVLEATMPSDDQIRTVSRSLSQGENAQANVSQERLWNASESITLPASKLREIAAREVAGAELKELEPTDFSDSR